MPDVWQHVFVTTGLLRIGPGPSKLPSFTALAWFAATACGGTTHQDATAPNGGKSGSDGRTGATQIITGGTHSTAATSGAGFGGAGGGGIAGSPIDLGGAGSNAAAGSGGVQAGQAGVGGVGGTENPWEGEGPIPVISGFSDVGRSTDWKRQPTP